MLGWFFLLGCSLCPGCDLAAPSPHWPLPRGMSWSSLPRKHNTESTSLLFPGMTCQRRGRARRRLVSGMEPLSFMLGTAGWLTLASPVYLASTGRLPGTVGKCWHCLSVPVCASRRNETSPHCAGYHSCFHSSRIWHPKTALGLPTLCPYQTHCHALGDTGRAHARDHQDQSAECCASPKRGSPRQPGHLSHCRDSPSASTSASSAGKDAHTTPEMGAWAAGSKSGKLRSPSCATHSHLWTTEHPTTTTHSPLHSPHPTFPWGLCPSQLLMSNDGGTW